MKKDWDALILLDGCRYDTLRNRTDLGQISSVISMGSESWEFMKANFLREAHHDTVYITANPHTEWLPDETFHYIYKLYQSEWDEESQTIQPEDVAAVAKKAQSEFPKKQLLIHFMQPHFPFLGEAGEEIDMRLSPSKSSNHPREHSATINPWYLARFNGHSISDLKQAYKENFDIVWETAHDLVSDLEGRIIVSSDHGNLIGERLWPIPIRGYGHPRGVRHDDLVRVPWVVFDGKRRTIVSEPPVGNKNIDKNIIEDRLQSLGYQ